MCAGIDGFELAYQNSWSSFPSRIGVVDPAWMMKISCLPLKRDVMRMTQIITNFDWNNVKWIVAIGAYQLKTMHWKSDLLSFLALPISKRAQ